jgi:DNA-cytosine methyltransferase
MTQPAPATWEVRPFTYATGCSGICAPEQGWRDLPWTCKFRAEIDPDCNAVSDYHFPEVPNRGAIENITAADGPVDLWVGGPPCQSFSVAGLRGGMDDPRGNLTLEFLRVADRLKAEWVVWENVPGILSSGGGKDFVVFLDALEELGYITDIDILDAQYFGVPQRRRRVFVCGQHRDGLLKAKTISSALTISQCLAENSLLVLAVLRVASVTGCKDLAFDAGEPRRSLQRRIKLFSLDADGQVSILAENLDVLLRWSECEPGGLESPPGKIGMEGAKTTRDIRSEGPEEADECQNTASSWKHILAESLRIMSECITSTVSSETTESKIFTCARLTLFMAERITQSMDCSPPFWSAASSLLIALREFIAYAYERQTSSNLFTGLEWIQPWSDFVRQARPVLHSLGNLRAGERRNPLFSIAESLCGNPPPSRRQGEDIAPMLEGGSDRRGWRDGEGGGGHVVAPCLTGNYGKQPDSSDTNAGPMLVFGGNRTSDPCEVAPALNACKTGSGQQDFESEAFVVGKGCERQTDVSCTIGTRAGNNPGNPQQRVVIVHTLRGEGHDASEDGTGRGAPLVACGIDGGEVGYALRAGASHSGDKGDGGVNTTMVFRERDRAGGRNLETQEDLAYSLTSPGTGGRTDSREMFDNEQRVRRLLPVECEKLQGFPPGWTLVPKGKGMMADSPRYRMIGNSMCVNVMRWIGERIQMVRDVQEALL